MILVIRTTRRKVKYYTKSDGTYELLNHDLKYDKYYIIKTEK